MSKRIMRWFGDRRNETVLDMVHNHLELTEKAVKELYEMVEAVGEGSTDKKPNRGFFSVWRLSLTNKNSSSSSNSGRTIPKYVGLRRA